MSSKETTISIISSTFVDIKPDSSFGVCSSAVESFCKSKHVPVSDLKPLEGVFDPEKNSLPFFAALSSMVPKTLSNDHSRLFCDLLQKAPSKQIAACSPLLAKILFLFREVLLKDKNDEWIALVMDCFHASQKDNPERNKVTLLHLAVVKAAFITKHFDAAEPVVHQKFKKFCPVLFSRDAFIEFLFFSGLILVSLNDLRSAMWRFHSCYSLSPQVLPSDEPPLFSFQAFVLYTLSAIALEGFVRYPLPTNVLVEERTMMKDDFAAALTKVVYSEQFTEIKGMLRVAQSLAKTAKDSDIQRFFFELKNNEKMIGSCGGFELGERAQVGLIRRAIKDIALLFSKISLVDLTKKLRLPTEYTDQVGSVVKQMLKDGTLIGTCEGAKDKCVVTMKVARRQFDSEGSADDLQELLELLISDKKKL